MVACSPQPSPDAQCSAYDALPFTCFVYALCLLALTCLPCCLSQLHCSVSVQLNKLLSHHSTPERPTAAAAPSLLPHSFALETWTHLFFNRLPA